MREHESKGELAVCAYDRASGWIVALNILVGASVLLAFLLWLGPAPQYPTETYPGDLVAGRGDHPQGFQLDVESPGADELAELTEPAIDRLLQEVTYVVSENAVVLDSQSFDFPNSIGQRGDVRTSGLLDEGDDLVPRSERWEVRYNSTSLDGYARQLDYFGIELAAVGGGERDVDYARQLTKNRPDHRTGRGDVEERRYMVWSGGALKTFDERLLRRAGVVTSGRIVVQFLPQSVDEQLDKLERARCETGRKTLKQVAKTVFGVRQVGSGFEYYIISQNYRVAPTVL